jgi:hypothetical protein
MLWGVAALAVALGRRLASDLYGRAILLLACAGAIGPIAWAERHVLRGGYPAAHVGGTLAIIVLLGIAVRTVRRRNVPPFVAAVVAAIVVATAAAAAGYGLATQDDRARLAAGGDQGRDLVHLWRSVLDLDRDGTSALLGGGDCDDLDATRYPGAVDIPGDGIDQDCDGADAPRVLAPARPPPAAAAAPVLVDRTRDLDIVVITIDALRFDLLAPGAPDRDDFPHITRLLDESLWFTHAIAPASATDVSLSTLLTGRYDPYQPIVTTLPEAMRGLGRTTTAAIPGEVLRFVGEVLLTRGFDRVATIRTDARVQNVGDHVSAGATVDEGVRALAESAATRRPCFVWLHFFDVHEHHQIDVPPALLAAVHPGGSPAIHKYRALLRAIDGELARLLAAAGDRAIIVFASDHGEALGDDPRLLDTHGVVAYGPLVQIPLALRIPGVAGARRPDPVSLVDLAPTLLALAGAPAAMAPLEGLDVLGDVPRDRAIAIHEEQQWSVVEWPYQLIVRPDGNIVELYDLERDPGEHANLAAAHADVVSRLRARYAEFPVVRVDRTPSGRTFREQQARPPPSRAPR